MITHATSWSSGPVVKASNWGTAAVIAGALYAMPHVATAQDHIPDNNWRQTDRPAPKPHETMFTAEIRFGPYWPNVDDEFTAKPGPYERVFGTDGRFYFGLEFDFLPLRIPYVGMFGPGFGWGWTNSSAKTFVHGSTKERTEEDTDLTIMPMHLSAVLRADELMRRTGFPFVPYLKVGPAVGVWSSGTTAGGSVVGDGCTVANPDGDNCIKAKDATWGMHVALGGAIALNFLDPRAASLLEHGSDVAHVYLFGEWMDMILTNFGGKGMHVGSSTVVVGLAADF